MPTTAEETIEAIRDTVERVIAKGFDDMIKKSIVERIDQYMAVGGDVNPEHMEHDKVRELLWDVRGYIKELEFDNWQKLEGIRELNYKIRKYKRLLDVAMEE